MEERGLTAYAVAQRSDGRISMSTAYRLSRLQGRVDNFDASVLDAMCDVFECEPGDLLERERPAPAAMRLPDSSQSLDAMTAAQLRDFLITLGHETQQARADALGISQAAVSKLEADPRKRINRRLAHTAELLRQLHRRV